MVFGRFQGDKRLAVQRADLAESITLLADLERRLGDVSQLQREFSAVWGAGIPLGLAEEVAKARDLADLLDGRARMAARELPDFDEAAAFVKRQLGLLDQRWKAFVALLLARKTLANPAAGVGACQRALVALALDLYRQLRTHIDELEQIGHMSPDVAALSEGVKGANEALTLYRGTLSAGEGELPESSTAMIMDLISMLQSKLLWIEDHRASLAVQIAMRAAFRNA